MRNLVIWGGAGMAGGELLRLTAKHPHFTVTGVVSRTHAGRPVWHLHPHLRERYGHLSFISVQEARGMETSLAFLALPHGVSLEVAPFYVGKNVPVVDLSGDFRLGSPQNYRRWYGQEHPQQSLLQEAVYGLPELHRGEMKSCQLISGVGCNATAGIIGLYPLARSGLIQKVHAEMRVGSTEGGASPSKGGHHPYRSGVVRVVSFFEHRHMGEILQETGLQEGQLYMTLTAVEMVRGVQMLARVELTRQVTEPELWKIYRSCWKDEPFVDFCPSRSAHLRFPDPRFVLGSNRVQIGFVLGEDGTTLLVGCALDNLMKGAAGTAVQGANILFGLDETAGLDMMPVYPA